MKTLPTGSLARATTFEALWAAWRRVKRGKSRRDSMARFAIDADRRILRLAKDLGTGRYVPGDCRLMVIRDPKLRLIAAPPVRDRVLHQAILTEIGSIYEASFRPESFACGTERGPQRAALRFLQSMRRFRYRVTLDVRRYFPSVDVEILAGLFARRLRDRPMALLLQRMLNAGTRVYASPLARRVLELDTDPVRTNCGLPLGGYLSHFSGALYLDGLDHFATRELRAAGYQRYMDDICLFGNDRGKLEDQRERLRAWLWRQRRLMLRRGRDAAIVNTQPATYLGYRISRAGVLPGPKAKRRLKQMLRDEHDPNALTRRLAAFRGHLLAI